MSHKPFVKYQYEPLDVETYSEPASETGAKMEGINHPDIPRMEEAFSSMDLQQAYGWLELNQKTFSPGTFIIDTADSQKVAQYRDLKPGLLFNRHSINKVLHLNTLLNTSNEVLAPGGYLWCHGRTSGLKRKMILRQYVFPLNYLIYNLHFLWHRACPKLPGLKKVYNSVTKGKNRTYNRIEILGRMSRAGFEIVDEQFFHGEFFVLGRKTKEPIWGEEPTCSPLIKLRRVGKDGDIIGVYKFRTMYSYSEYLQDYMYKHGGLAEGGKFKDDCRVSRWGKFLRTCWLDELPMMLNWLRGDLKLVGVRPLSLQYFSLYAPEMQELRIRVKPGLIPPFYYERETPKTIEDVQESERRYIEACLESPAATDWRYFWGSIANIIFRRKRSK